MSSLDGMVCEDNVPLSVERYSTHSKCSDSEASYERLSGILEVAAHKLHASVITENYRKLCPAVERIGVSAAMISTRGIVWLECYTLILYG
jgi:hypothetical protein